MITADIHTHTTYSSDGRSDLRDMAEAAVQAGLKIYGVCAHFD